MKKKPNIYEFSKVLFWDVDLSDFDLSNVTLIKPKNDEDIAHYMNISHIFV